MATISPLIEIGVPHKGVRRDLRQRDVPRNALWEADNFVIRNGIFRVRPGATVFGNDLNERPLGYVQYEHNDGTIRTVQGTDKGWHKYNVGTGNWDDISGTALTGGDVNQVVFRVFQKAGATFLLSVNAKDSPKKWDGDAATYSAMGGSPPTAKCMAINSDRILLANLTSGGTQSGSAIDVSANKDFDSGWGSVLVLILADTPGDIVSMMEMGNLVTAILKSDAIYLASAQGGAVPFRFDLKEASNDMGPVSPLAVIPGPGGTVIYLARDLTVKIFDGVRARSISKHIDDHLKKTVDRNRFNRAFLIWDSERQEIWVIYPQTGSNDPNVGVIINIKTFAMWPISWTSLLPSAGISMFIETGTTIGDLQGTIGQQTGTIGDYASQVRRTVLGDKGGISHEDIGSDDAGTAIPIHAETGLDNLGDARRFKTLKDVFHLLSQTPSTQNITVKIGTSSNGQGRTLSAGKTVDLSDTPPFVTEHRITAQEFSVRYEGSATQPITGDGMSISGQMRGVR